MMKYLYIATMVFLASCGQTDNNPNKNEVVIADTITKTEETASKRNFKLTDKTVKFLWREDSYDQELKDTFNKIVINEELCKALTEPEIAVLGYVGTYIGSECQWDGECNDDRSNLKCKVLTALNLGYQCSDKHLGFLRKWFKNDKKVLAEFDYNCPTKPYTASSQNAFDEIKLTVKGNDISVWFSVIGVNMPMGESWSYTETNYFQLNNDNVRLIKKEQSKVKREHFDTGE